LVEAVRVFTRYDLAEEGDEENTRRKRNERVGIDTPKFEIPENGFYLWDWFNQINNSVSRIDFNGYYCSIPPSEFLAWSKLTGNCLTPEEYDILRAMDGIFCKELNAEITSKRAREEDARKREMEAKSVRVRRR
jgi:hypothetical protein